MTTATRRRLYYLLAILLLAATGAEHCRQRGTDAALHARLAQLPREYRALRRQHQAAHRRWQFHRAASRRFWTRFATVNLTGRPPAPIDAVPHR